MKTNTMETNTLIISEKDYTSLIDLIKAERSFKSTPEEHLQTLGEELKKAKKVDALKLPSNVIRMHSEIILQDLQNKNEIKIQLVYPHESNIKERKISILAPIGTALIGYQEGDTVEWQIPSGIGRYTILKVNNNTQN